MSRRVAGWIFAVAVVLVVVAIWLVRAPSQQPDAVDELRSAGSSAQDTFPVRLFYPGPGGFLREHSVELPRPRAAVDEAATRRNDPRMRAVLERFLAGPAPEGAQLAFPEGTTVQSIDRAAGGVVFVSLGLPEGASLNVGSRSELLMVYGLVNSLAYSLPEIERVALLWTGVQPATFAGHVDTTRPLAPSRKWVREEGNS